MKEEKEEDRVAILAQFAPILSQYLPLVEGVAFPGKEQIITFVELMIKTLQGFHRHDEIAEWVFWLLKETYTPVSSYSNQCENRLDNIIQFIRSNGNHVRFTIHLKLFKLGIDHLHIDCYPSRHLFCNSILFHPTCTKNNAYRV